MTWQTGYPLSVDYSRGFPQYEPARRGMERLGTGGFRAVLIVGSVALEDSHTQTLDRLNTILIGPRASEAGFETRVAIDTGVAGIHEAGTAYRTDEVPLRLHPPLAQQRSAVEVLAALLARVRVATGTPNE